MGITRFVQNRPLECQGLEGKPWVALGQDQCQDDEGITSEGRVQDREHCEKAYTHSDDEGSENGDCHITLKQDDQVVVQSFLFQ